MPRTIKLRRSVVKALTYRIVIMILDFIAIYLFTGTARIAVGFVIVSNIYTTIGYFLHERAWSRIPWGIEDGIG
jgi:uncharacterized membrane protein